MKISKILVPVDFTETSSNVAMKAAEAAKSLNAEISLLHVIEMKNIPLLSAHELLMTPANPLETEAASKKWIEKMSDSISKSTGIKPKTIVENGRISSTIIEVAHKEKANLIVIGAHGEYGFDELFIGTNAQRVVTLSDIPVLTIGEKAIDSGFKKILIPIDNSIHSRQKVNLAMVFAKAFHSEVHLIGLPDSDEKSEVHKFKIKMESVEKIIKENNLKYVSKIIHGSSLAKSALGYAKENNCDLIVINTGHESNITGTFLGLFAQQIVNHSEVPVLNIKHLQDHYIIETPGFGV